MCARRPVVHLVFGEWRRPVNPLLIGFTLLLIVISVLGYLSTRKIDDVGFAVLDLERQYAAQSQPVT